MKKRLMGFGKGIFEEEKSRQMGNRRTNALILHVDGDRKYSQKSARYYNKLGLRAIVKNIPENRQPQIIGALVKRYDPDIIVITGHDRDDKKWNRL